MTSNAELLRPPAIGILGGMGPDASVELMRRVLAATPAHDDCDHVHLILDSNPHVPSRIAALVEGHGENPAPELVRMARRLVRADARVLAIACNTAHYYLDEIRVAVPEALVLDMVELTADAAAARVPARRKVGLLASSAVQRIGLYARALAVRDIECIFPARQPEVMEIIRRVKGGEVSAQDRADLAEIAQSLLADGADLLVIACTEISFIADVLPNVLPRIDALDLLADEIVRLGTSGGQAYPALATPSVLK